MTVNLPHAAQAKAESNNKREPKRLLNYEEEMTECTFNDISPQWQLSKLDHVNLLNTPLKIPNLHMRISQIKKNSIQLKI